jgi:hypothetical protein
MKKADMPPPPPIPPCNAKDLPTALLYAMWCKSKTSMQMDERENGKKKAGFRPKARNILWGDAVVLCCDVI